MLEQNTVQYPGDKKYTREGWKKLKIILIIRYALLFDTITVNWVSVFNMNIAQTSKAYQIQRSINDSAEPKRHRSGREKLHII
jgi:hypothetical protein